MHKDIRGFTLIEVLITVTIVAILAAIAVPTYLHYSTRAYYSEIISATTPYKVGVSECYQESGTLTGCNGGTPKIPANVTTPQGGVASVTVSNGVITVVPVVQNGIQSTDTYILTPSTASNMLLWTAGGGGVSNGYGS